MARLVKLREMNASPPPPPQSALSLAVSSPPTPSIAYPPIYLSPSIDAFTPSPSPLPAVLSAHHHSLSQAAVVGGAVAGLVTVAVVATVLSTAAAKVGASCLFTPALQLLSSLGTKFGICRKWLSWNSKKDNSDHEDDVIGPQGLRPLAGTNTLEKAGKGAAGAESLANCLQDQGVVEGDVGPSTQTFISTSMSEFAASELENHELMIEPLKEIGREAHYAQAFLSTNIGNFAASEFEKQGTIINELIRREQRISSPRAISKYAATELRKQEFLSKEVVTLDVDQMSRNAATPNYQPITSASLSTYDASTAVTPRPGLIETSVAEKNVQDKGGKNERGDIKTMDDINGVGKLKANLGATSGDKANSLGEEAAATAGPIVPMPAKTMKTAGWHATAADGGSSTPSTTEHVSLTRTRPPTNLGHVSLNCEMSIHRFRFFALCNSSGTLGSPPPSYLGADNNNNNYNNYYYYNNYPGRRPVPRYNQELGNHNCALLENPQDLSSSDNTHYVQRSVQPIMQSYQCITAAPATTPVQTCLQSTTPEVINPLWSSQHDSRPTIQEYGHPYYGA